MKWKKLLFFMIICLVLVTVPQGILASTTGHIKVGDYVQFGSYNDGLRSSLLNSDCTGFS